MSEFIANFAAIDASEIVQVLLKETGQTEGMAVNTSQILAHLNIEQLTFDFERHVPKECWGNSQDAPKALLDFRECLIAVDEKLYPKKQRFAVLHEVGHYVLPDHREQLYICDKEDLSPKANIILEKQANEFAAELLFKGNEFNRDANSYRVSAASVKQLAEKYDASFEATARRLAEKNSQPVLMGVFAKAHDNKWYVDYCHSSVSFRSRYFSEIKGVLPAGLGSDLEVRGRDIADVEKDVITIESTDEKKKNSFNAEFFTNSYKIFCFLTPVSPVGTV